jgi:hypothetical protein
MGTQGQEHFNEVKEKMMKSKRQLEWAVSFWIGIGLMSIINVWKINQNQHALLYSWIMFGVSVIFITICLILIKIKK